MIEVYVGTSGWLYDWNLGMSLEWYVRNSGLNAIELNASFYRFPFKNQINAWSRKGRNLRWSIKVHRYITHVCRLSDKSLDAWNKLRELFKPMDGLIDFYLIQLPPTYTYSDNYLSRLKEFIRNSGMPSKLAIEFRHQSWFNYSDKLCKDLDEAVIVSVDSPQLTQLIKCKDVIYLRLHGRSSWYSHNYSDTEINGLVNEIRNLMPRRVYVFFNNDHWMLENARKMLTKLREVLL